MLRTLLILFCLSACSGGVHQYQSASIFAHNDYLQPSPFQNAHSHEVGFIEADVFLIDGDLSVAHHREEIENGKTLDALYLKPLAGVIRHNKGRPYPSGQQLTLMIDLKSEGPPTLREIVAQVSRYTELITASGLKIMISGNVPEPGTWNEYPAYIWFDGRPGTAYTEEQLKRVAMISTSFRDHSDWGGSTPLPEAARKKILSLMQQVHDQGKPIRFWATPDTEEAWQHLMDLHMDVIVTDRVDALFNFIEMRNKTGR